MLAGGLCRLLVGINFLREGDVRLASVNFDTHTAILGWKVSEGGVWDTVGEGESEGGCEGESEGMSEGGCEGGMSEDE